MGAVATGTSSSSSPSSSLGSHRGPGTTFRYSTGNSSNSTSSSGNSSSTHIGTSIGTTASIIAGTASSASTAAGVAVAKATILSMANGLDASSAASATATVTAAASPSASVTSSPANSDENPHSRIIVLGILAGFIVLAMVCSICTCGRNALGIDELDEDGYTPRTFRERCFNWRPRPHKPKDEDNFMELGYQQEDRRQQRITQRSLSVYSQNSEISQHAQRSHSRMDYHQAWISAKYQE